VVVTHDRSFLDRIARRLLVFGRDAAGRATTAQFAGGWSEYVARREEAAAAALAKVALARAAEVKAAAGRSPAVRASAPAPAQPADGPLSKNEIRRRQEWIEQAEAEIAALEQEKERLLAELADAGTKPEARVAASKRIVEAEGEIEELLGKWEEWGREIS
jgi:ATPase subunit of ABC transporter with duplicated ATPase domains